MHKVLVVGVGSIGERHLRCFQETGRAEVAFVEIDPDLRQSITDGYDVPGYVDLKEALDQGPTVAVVATPAQLHVSLAAQLVEAGIHVLIEKPLSIDTGGIDELQDIVARAQVTVGVAYVYRCHPLFLALREALTSGRFGRPLELIVVAGQHFPTYRPAYRDIYYAQRATGGGAIQDALTHLVNAGEWLVGPVTRLVADAEHQQLPGVEVEDTVHLLARHATDDHTSGGDAKVKIANVMASYSLNQHQAANEMSFTIVCEEGTVRCELHRNRWSWITRPDTAWQNTDLSPQPRDAIFIAQAHQFLDAVENKSRPPCTLDEGIQTLRVNLAALASLETNTWQTIPD